MRISSIILGCFALALASLSATAMAQTGDTGLQSLRGGVPLQESGPAAAIPEPDTGSGRFPRAFRQQPPMIPHAIDDYRVDLKVNQCLDCHDWPNNVDMGAPKVSTTHYLDRGGVARDQVARNLWFCTQCHAPQTEASALVRNTFKSGVEVE
jgi:cytochrome c-type protein NapB